MPEVARADVRPVVAASPMGDLLCAARTRKARTPIRLIGRDNDDLQWRVCAERHEVVGAGRRISVRAFGAQSSVIVPAWEAATNLMTSPMASHSSLGSAALTSVSAVNSARASSNNSIRPRSRSVSSWRATSARSADVDSGPRR